MRLQVSSLEHQVEDLTAQIDESKSSFANQIDEYRKKVSDIQKNLEKEIANRVEAMSVSEDLRVELSELKNELQVKNRVRL